MAAAVGDDDEGQALYTCGLNPKILISLNTAWNLFNFRAGLIRALVDKGYEVVAVAPPDEYVARVKALGCRFVPLPMDNKGTHPGRDLLLLWRFYRLLRRERPAVYLGYTVKPNIYGSLVARALGIPVINNIAGLGAAFIHESWLTKIVRRLYRFALSGSNKVFFQNEDDRKLFIDSRLVAVDKSDRLPGSGIDLQRFAFVPRVVSYEDPVLRFLLIARLLWDKGIGEYVAAAQVIKKRYPHAIFDLLGFVDGSSPAAVTRAQLDSWQAEGVISYLGKSDQVADVIAACDCVVLPSYYREGVPRTLLEAAAVGRPIITTDTVGCRDVVDDGVNGFLCQVRDLADLVAAMEKMIVLSPDQRAAMGRRGREKMEREFDEQIVINKYLEALRDIVAAV